MSKEKYLLYIENALKCGREMYEENIDKWRKNFNPGYYFGYMPPVHIPLQAHVEGFMYSVNGNIEHALWTKKCLLEIEELKKIYPSDKKKSHPEYEKGIPAMDGAFSLQPYIHGYLYIKDSGVMNEEEKQQVENTIKGCVHAMLHFPEWGAHNRSMLRVWSLALAAKVLASYNEANEWRKLADCLAEETLGGWSIEDASHYIALWLHATIRYAEVTGKEQEYYAMPQTRYYFDYITRLITPYGQIPDFGDTHFNSNWYIWLECLEKGVAIYKCRQMRFAADKIWDFAINGIYQKNVINEYKAVDNNLRYSTAIASHFVYAYTDANDGVIPVKPQRDCEEVLEDLIGKKIAFRNGWDKDSTYLLLNYRDEGGYGFIPRRYLRTTLSVRAEKMHHGHSDENSVSLFVKDGNILLNDGGYRENLPNGKYRNDIYHNRLVFRKGLKNENTDLYDFLHDEGHYKHTVTEKLHFQNFERLSMSRTRVYESKTDMVWDRIITYLKDEDVFVILDCVFNNKEGDITIANLWHTGRILNMNENSYDTCIPYIYKGPGDKDPYVNKDDLALNIAFADQDKQAGFNIIKRGYGESVMLYQYVSEYLKQGQIKCFTTVLTPHDKSTETVCCKGKVTVEPTCNNEGISIVYQGKNTVYLTYKIDLDKGISPDEDLYPRYTWEEGKISYGKIITDSDFSYVEDTKEKILYGFINGSGLEYNRSGLFYTPKFTTYSFTSDKSAVTDHKWKAWYGEVKKGVLEDNAKI